MRRSDYGTWKYVAARLHRQHGRRHGGDAAITVVTKTLAPMSQGGRAWPRAEAFDGALHLTGYAVAGAGTAELRLSALFRQLPVAVLKARYEGALKPARKRVRA